MWRLSRRQIGAAAAVFAAALLLGPVPARAGDGPAQTLAAELLIARGDLGWIARPDLPAAHRRGFVDRVGGALGLLPWLLTVAGDAEGADGVAAWQGAWRGEADQLAELAGLLDALAARHPLDTSALDVGVTRADLAEARAIHDSYCAACHDGMGAGAPEFEIAARDLSWFARNEETEVFLARLVNGVRGDETIGFANPLTTRQIAALWKLYSFH